MVIAIIALLIAILLPTLQWVRRQAKAVICQSNLRQWGLIFSMYISDWRHLWMEALWPYYRHSNGICYCPMAVKRSGRPRLGANEMGGTFTTWSVFTGYYSWDREGLFGSYGINGWTRNPPWKYNTLRALYGS